MKRLLGFLLALLCVLPHAAAAETPTVTVSVYSYLDDTYLVAPRSVELTDGMTAFSVLRSLEVDFAHKNGYVTEIEGLKEKANGPYSGWSYDVDGQRPKMSAARYKLQSGQTVKWIYSVTAEQAGIADFSDASSETASVETVSQAATSSAQMPPVSQTASAPEPEVSETGSAVASSESAETSSETASEGETETKAPTDVSRKITDAINWLADNPGDWTALVLALDGRTAPKDWIPDAHDDVRITDTQRRLLLSGATGHMSPDEMISLASQIAGDGNLYNESLNGAIFALISCKAAGRPDLAEGCVTHLLDKQNADGGFALYDDLASDVDVTAMALYALQSLDMEKTDQAEQQAMAWLLAQMNADGSFGAPANGESTAQALMALSVCEAEPAILDKIAAALCRFQTDAGGFSHLADGQESSMATEQAVMGLFTYQNKTLPYYIKTKMPDTAPVPWVLILAGAVILAGGIGAFAVIKGRKGRKATHE